MAPTAADWTASAHWHPTTRFDSVQQPQIQPTSQLHRLVEPSSCAPAAMVMRTNVLDPQITLPLAEMERGYARLGISRGSLRPSTKYDGKPRPPSQRKPATPHSPVSPPQRQTDTPAASFYRERSSHERLGSAPGALFGRPTTADTWVEDRFELRASTFSSRPDSSSAAHRAGFEPSAAFAGPRLGSVYKKGLRGLGYYTDRGPQFAKYANHHGMCAATLRLVRN